MEDVTWGERMLAIFGLVLAGGLAYMAIDVLGNGWLTRSLRPVAHLATVTQLPTPEEPPAS